MGTPDSKTADLQKYYDEMSAAKKRIVGPLVGITLVAFFLQQVLTNFTSVMDFEVTKGLSFAYLYGFALFFLVIVLTMYYKSAMEKVEKAHRPPHLDTTEASYEDFRAWEQHQAELEAEEEEREDLQREALKDEIRTAHRHTPEEKK